MTALIAYAPFVLAALAAAFLVAAPLWRGGRQQGSDPEIDLEAHRQRLRELEDDLAAGLIDSEAYAEARAEAERELLQAGDAAAAQGSPTRPSRPFPLVALAIGLAVPTGAFILYAVTGRPALMFADTASGSRAETAQLADVREKLPKLRARVAQRPEDVDAWIMLARALVTLERPAEAAAVTNRALEAVGERPSLLVQQARAIAAAEGRFTAEAVDALDRVLARAPADPDALWFRGLAAAQRGESARARGYWNRLRNVLPDDMKDTLDEMLARLPADESATGKASAKSLELTVEVRLAPAIAAQVPVEATVFVFARRAGTTGMPLAAARTSVAALPATVALDSSMARAAGQTLGPNETLEIVARVSSSGRTDASASNFEGRSRLSTKQAMESVEIVVDSRR